jgi:hypothetical protein
VRLARAAVRNFASVSFQPSAERESPKAKNPSLAAGVLREVVGARRRSDAQSPCARVRHPLCRGHHPLSSRRRVQPDAERLRDAQDGLEPGVR